MMLFPSLLESLKLGPVRSLSDQVTIMPFHFGDASMFLHHFLEMAAAL